MKYEYSSIQANFSSEASRQFLKESKKLIKSSDLYKPESDKGFESNPHVTILYGLHDVNPPICAMDIINSHPKFNISLGPISLFKGNETGEPFDVIKVNVISSDVYALNAAIADACEYTSDFPEYIPHATVAFVKQGTHDHLDGNPALAGLSFMVDNLVYSSTNGTQRILPLGQK